MTDRPDVLVVGAGFAGLATARELARAGAVVVVLETRERTGLGASGAGAGMLAPLAEVPSSAPFFAAARAARDLWKSWAEALAEESGSPVEIDRSGTLVVAATADDHRHLDAIVAAARAAGEDASEVPLTTARELVPDLSPAIERVLHLPGDHRVDNQQAVAALAIAAERAGATVVTGTPIEELANGPHGVTVRNDRATFRARQAVLAAGAWAAMLAPPGSLPVRPVRGQMIRLGDVRWPFRGAVRAARGYAVPRGGDGLLIGSTVEEAGFAADPTPDGLSQLIEIQRRLFPGLADARLESCWAGLRPGSPDGLPILGATERVVGPDGRDLSAGSGRVVAACGLFRNGILLAPWVGQMIARSVLSCDDPPELHPFSPARFTAPPRAPIDTAHPIG